ncbi:MAG: hypothetical protein AAF495_14720 [Pseudomonadota bacterium]
MPPLLSLIAIPFVALMLSAPPAQARDRANIVVIGEDFDLGTLPRDTQVYRGVLETLSGALHDAGFAIYDETSVTLDEFTQGRSHRSEAEIVDIARSVSRPPLDIAVLFSIYAYVQDFTYTKKVTSRLTARVLDLGSGRRIGSFELIPARQLRLPQNCARACTMARLEGRLRPLAAELSANLVAHLETVGARRALAIAPDQPIPAGYRLVFADFSAEEVADIEEYLVVFTGYRLHRPIETGRGRHEFWYESTSSRARLNRNLIKMLDHVRLGGRVNFVEDTFTVTKAAASATAEKPWDAW